MVAGAHDGFKLDAGRYRAPIEEFADTILSKFH
jgi:hypothetical protein